MRRFFPLLGLLAIALFAQGDLYGQESCPVTSPTTTQAGSTLETFADNGSGGVVFNSDTGALELKREGGAFGTEGVAVATGRPIRVGAGGDFDNDGWDDVVVANRGFPQYIQFLRNLTATSPEPADWSDPTQRRTPVFDTSSTPFFSVSLSCSNTIASGDFDGDGNLDVAQLRCTTDSSGLLGAADMFRGNGDGTFQAPYQFHSNAANLGYIKASSTSMQSVDWNGDGNLDIIFGNATSSLGDVGQIMVLRNNGASPPAFSEQILLTGIPFDVDGAASIAFADFTGDGNMDIVAGSPTSSTTAAKRLRMWPGDGAGGLLTPAISLTNATEVYAQALFAADFNLDGHVDLFWGVDGYGAGSQGQAYLWRNEGDGTPFDSTSPVLLPASGVADLDGGALIDYDNDPDGTLDVFIGDGQSTGNTYVVYANRVTPDFVQCGEVISDILPLGSLDDDEFVVTSARINNPLANSNPNGETITWFMSNETPPNWVEATDCGGDLCATFPSASGRDVRWKAELCTADPLRSPTISQVDIEFDYQPGVEHFRAGVVVHAGTVFAGGLRQPGDRGKLYAFPAGFTSSDSGTFLWELGTNLDAMADGDRKIYTTDTTAKILIPFNVSDAQSTPDGTGGNLDDELRDTLGVADNSAASDLITWQRSARFQGAPGFPATRLGAIVHSTAAVLSRPGLPLYYAHLQQDSPNSAIADRALIDQFINDRSDRVEVLLVGSKDGAVHAIRTEAGHAEDGQEKWALIPKSIASKFAADKVEYDNGTPQWARAFPDGSPALADIYDTSTDPPTVKTVMLMGGGAGSESVFALDVTESVSESDRTTVDPFAVTPSGPKPLWEIVPGAPDSGLAFSKPVLVRTHDTDPPSSLNGRFLAVMATGIDPGDPTPPFTAGRRVVAVDVATGSVVWHFDAKCAVTSDILAFETDDLGESVRILPFPPGTGEPIDGFVDRIVFADYCGYLYKLDPNETPGANRFITSIGAVNTGETDGDGNPVNALFWTGADMPAAAGNGLDAFGAGATGEVRPIVGTIAGRPDGTTRMVLFFGTGGLESFDPSLPNEFYAIYADTGEVRTKFVGTCTGTPGNCQKFYGGTVVTESQVIVTISSDPINGASCDLGESETKVFSLDDVLTDGNFDEQASSGLNGSAAVSPVFGADNAIYLATLDGSIVRLGTPTQTAPGGVPPQGVGTGDGYIKGDILAVSGWRQVLY
jgi:hypothetical protein